MVEEQPLLRALARVSRQLRSAYKHSLRVELVLEDEGLRNPRPVEVRNKLEHRRPAADERVVVGFFGVHKQHVEHHVRPAPHVAPRRVASIAEGRDHPRASVEEDTPHEQRLSAGIGMLERLWRLACFLQDGGDGGHVERAEPVGALEHPNLLQESRRVGREVEQLHGTLQQHA